MHAVRQRKSSRTQSSDKFNFAIILEKRGHPCALPDRRKAIGLYTDLLLGAKMQIPEQRRSVVRVICCGVRFLVRIRKE
jgi:hypothetical protein